MSKINPYRMLGRISRLAFPLMMRYDLRPTQVVPDVRILLIALSQKLDAPDSDLCIECVEKYEEYVEEGKALNLSQSEIDRLMREGADECEYILKAHWFNRAKYLLRDEDFLAEREAKQQAARIRTRRVLTVIGCAVAAIVAGVVIFNLPYFKEMRAYGKVKHACASADERSLSYAVGEYIDKYPQGKHFDDVMMMPVSCALGKEDNALERLNAAEDYLLQLPQGQHAAECQQVISDVWDAEIAKYQSSVDTITEASEFVVDMLRYMKSQNIREIAVNPIPELDLKDYNDYPEWIRTLTEYMYQDAGVVIYPSSLKIKDKITEREVSGWVGDVTKALNSGFNLVLTPDFIRFVTVSDDVYGHDPRRPQVNATFTVKTQEDEYGCPNLWLYTHTVTKTTRSGGYYSYSTPQTTTNKSWVLGISMDFDMEFKLPDSDKTYNFVGSGDPGSAEIKNVTPEKAYGVMCGRCSQVFARDLAEQLGLPQEADQPQEEAE